jgi:MoxR-like ATPase
LKHEIGKRIVGHDDLVGGILACLLASGHVLLEGVPGLGKTMLVKTLSDALHLEFARIQFTPDLMPADIIGTQMVAHDEQGNRHFQFQPGPVFTQLLLADEINRATPKTQSALLEAMEENKVTVGRTGHALDQPFMVLATQNPIEMEGTYPLPEAQLDRFLLKLIAEYPNETELSTIIDLSTGGREVAVEPVLTRDELEALRLLTRTVAVAGHVKQFAVRVVLASHASNEAAPDLTRRYVRHGASPRGVLSMILVAKAFALFDGRLNVGFDRRNHSRDAGYRLRAQVSAAIHDAGLLFDAEFLRKLERLELLANKIFRGLIRGEHATPRRGRGIEFADFRRYRPGDDLRYIDWNIFARLDRLFLKLYTSEEDLTLHVLLDASASMDFGEPRKFDYARKLAAALAYIGLCSLDRVGLGVFTDSLGARLPVLKTRQQMASVLDFLTARQSGGHTDFAHSLQTFATRNPNPGLVVLITDLLGGSGARPGLDALRYGGHDLMVVQLLAEEEIDPPLAGALTLMDAEDGSELKVTVDAELRSLYQDRLQRSLEEVENYCRRCGCEYLRASTAIPFEDVMLKYLRQGRFWR